MNPYIKLIEKLVLGEIKELDVDRANLMAFREVWLKRPERKSIIGEAHHGGDITYRFIKVQL